MPGSLGGSELGALLRLPRDLHRGRQLRQAPVARAVQAARRRRAGARRPGSVEVARDGRGLVAADDEGDRECLASGKPSQVGRAGQRGSSTRRRRRFAADPKAAGRLSFSRICRWHTFIPGMSTASAGRDSQLQRLPRGRDNDIAAGSASRSAVRGNGLIEWKIFPRDGCQFPNGSITK